MGKLIDMTGQRWGKLTVQCRVESRNGETRAFWLCGCDCGQQTVVSGKYLRTGVTRSCGCLANDWAKRMGSDRAFIATRAEKMTRHGHKRQNQVSAEYRTWLGMKRRCYDKNCKDFPNWGGKGIGVCDRWERSFEAFLADMGQRPPGHTIDRLDPTKDYSPDNCRWATFVQQGSENRAGLEEVTVFGLTFSSKSKAARHFGLNDTTVQERLKRGDTIEEAYRSKAWTEKPRRTRESYLPKSHPDRSS